jgi:GNAT superfamily N-acetyltransferase
LPGKVKACADDLAHHYTRPAARGAGLGRWLGDQQTALHRHYRRHGVIHTTHIGGCACGVLSGDERITTIQALINTNIEYPSIPTQLQNLEAHEVTY